MNRQAEPLRYDVVAAAELTKTVKAAAALPAGAVVLGATANAHLNRCELAAGEVIIKGTVQFCGMVRMEEGAVPINAMADFDFSQTLPGMNKALASGSVCCTACQLTGENGGQFAAMLDITLFACMPKEQEVVSNLEDKNVFSMGKSVKSSSLFGRFSQRFSLQENMELTARMPEIKEVLAQNCSVNIQEARCTQGQILVNGQVTVAITYSCRDEYEPVAQIADRFDFSQMIEAANINEDMQLHINGSVENCSVAVLPNLENEQRVLNCDCNLMLGADVFANQEHQVLTDAYSDAYMLNNEFTRLPLRQMMACRQVEMTVRLRAQKPENRPPISRISAVFAAPCVRSGDMREGYANINGSAAVTVVYLASATGELSSFYCEVPFGEEVACAECGTEGTVRFTPVVTECLGVLVNSGEVEVRLSMAGWLTAFSEMEQTVLCNANKGGELAEQKGISIYITQPKDTLWSIGKTMNVSPKMLKSINPDMTDNPDPNTKLLIYHQLK